MEKNSLSKAPADLQDESLPLGAAAKFPSTPLPGEERVKQDNPCPAGDLRSMPGAEATPTNKAISEKPAAQPAPLSTLRGPALCLDQEPKDRQPLARGPALAGPEKNRGVSRPAPDMLSRIIKWLAQLLKKLDDLIFLHTPTQAAPKTQRKLRLKKGRYIPEELEAAAPEEPQSEELCGKDDADVRAREKLDAERAQTPKRE